MIEFYRKNRFILTIVAVGVITFVFCFFYFYESNDLFKFPFDSNVWGTVSDWVMAIGAIVSLVLILKTVRLQIDANKLNKLLTDIAIFRRVESIKPEIKLEGEPPVYPTVKVGVLATKYYILVKKNKIKNVELSIVYKTNSIENNIEKSFDEIKPEGRIDLAKNIEIDIKNFSSERFDINIVMTYLDIDNNKYRHTFEIIKMTGKIHSETKERQILLQQVDW